MTPFDWQEFLALARRFMGDAPDEAALRTAISRAYSSAYHAAAMLVRAEGLLATNHTHQAVWNVLAKEQDATRARIGIRGADLKRICLDADYAATFPGDLVKQARIAITRSEALIEALADLT